MLVIDHHTTESNLSFEQTLLSVEAVATGEVIYDIASSNDWPISAQAAEDMLVAIMSDSLGLTTQNVTARTFEVCGKLVALGAKTPILKNAVVNS